MSRDETGPAAHAAASGAPGLVPGRVLARTALLTQASSVCPVRLISAPRAALSTPPSPFTSRFRQGVQLQGRRGVSILSLGTSALPNDSVSSADLISTLPMSLSSHRSRRAASRGRRLGREPPLGMCTHPPGPPASISCEPACLPEPLQAWCQQSHLRGPGRER